MSEVTRILSKIESGDQQVAEELLPLVYEELRKLAAVRMAGDRPDHTLQATALVHEAFMRLVDVDQAQRWNSRGHFFAAAAEAMRRILVEAARRKMSVRRGGEHHRVDAELAALAANYKSEEVLIIDQKLNKLRSEMPEIAKLVELKYFAGFTLEEIAQQRKVSVRTVHRHWAFAKAWLREAIESESAAD